MPTLELGQLGLLVGREDLKKCGPGLGMCGDHLGRQIADIGRSLVDGCRVIVFNGGIQAFVRRFHIAVYGGLVPGSAVEDGRRLLLLRGG